MTHVYTSTFFDYIDEGALTSARAVIDALNPELKPQSVLDLGCGRGVWLQEWQDAGVAKVCGVDGSYVDVNNLAIKPEDFVPADLTRPFVPKIGSILLKALRLVNTCPKRRRRPLCKASFRPATACCFQPPLSGKAANFTSTNNR